MSELTLSERLAGVLGEHREVRWSDRTFACQGCSERTREHAEANWPESPDERRALQVKCNRAMKPNWTSEEYLAHVAQALTAVVAEWVVSERVVDSAHDSVATPDGSIAYADTEAITAALAAVAWEAGR